MRIKLSTCFQIEIILLAIWLAVTTQKGAVQQQYLNEQAANTNSAITAGRSAAHRH